MVKTALMLACPDCDLLHRAGRPQRHTMQLCVRCGAVLGRGRSATLETVLALYLTALVLFCLANAFPLLDLRLHGTVREASIPGCVRILATLGWPWLSAILVTTVVLGPLVHLVGMAAVLLQLTRGREGAWTARAFRILEEFRRWGMVEVFVLGVLVSYSKLARMATVVPGPSLYALAGFLLVAALAIASLDPREVWEGVAHCTQAPGAPDPHPAGGPSARLAGLQACSACGLMAPLDRQGSCSRCGASLHSRKPDSTGRTWALLIASVLLYIPANVLPVTQVVSLGRAHEDTIISGVVYFLRTGSWPLALLIFVASVLVPLAKFVILSFLLLSVRFRSRWRPQARAGLYRLTEMVGRWSMVDIFAITIMVAMLQMGSMASVVPRPGAMAFAMMVVATIMAVHSFDPRLVWDALEPDHG
ncbi:MAG: paraquat-inducible protein A [Holophaga sp.]|nr:paraquat-inducible protein A [Holophaga sp.]